METQGRGTSPVSHKAKMKTWLYAGTSEYPTIPKGENLLVRTTSREEVYYIECPTRDELEQYRRDVVCYDRKRQIDIHINRCTKCRYMMNNWHDTYFWR